MAKPQEASTTAFIVGHTDMDPERPEDRDFLEACVGETVKKRGSAWVVFDDDTGVELGSYPDRKTAWEKQRQHRQQAQAKKKTQAAANKLRRKLMRKKKDKKKVSESFLNTLVANLLSENMVSYVFEQSPTSEDELGWEELITRISHETLQSDPKLAALIDATHKARIKVLNKAVDSVKKTLESTKAFTVDKIKASKDAEGKIVVNFVVLMKQAKKALPFIIGIQHNKPVISFPEESKAHLNAMATDESKLLRAELLHAQETLLDNMDDIAKAASKRNRYLGDKEKQLDKMVRNMVPLEIALLKNLLKAKYKGMK